MLVDLYLVNLIDYLSFLIDFYVITFKPSRPISILILQAYCVLRQYWLTTYAQFTACKWAYHVVITQTRSSLLFHLYIHFDTSLYFFIGHRFRCSISPGLLLQRFVEHFRRYGCYLCPGRLCFLVSNIETLTFALSPYTSLYLLTRVILLMSSRHHRLGLKANGSTVIDDQLNTSTYGHSIWCSRRFLMHIMHRVFYPASIMCPWSSVVD